MATKLNNHPITCTKAFNTVLNSINWKAFSRIVFEKSFRGEYLIQSPLFPIIVPASKFIEITFTRDRSIQVLRLPTHSVFALQFPDRQGSTLKTRPFSASVIILICLYRYRRPKFWAESCRKINRQLLWVSGWENNKAMGRKYLGEMLILPARRDRSEGKQSFRK